MLFSVNLVFLATTCFISSYAYKCGLPKRNVWTNNDDYDNRMIIEGRVPKRHELPWVALVLFYHASDDISARHWCSGSIISPKHVLTALHCVTKNHSLHPSDIDHSQYAIKVKVGSQYKNGGGKFNVRYYDAFAFENGFADFVVLHLDDTISFRVLDAAPICLSERRPGDGETLIVAGHGAHINRWNVSRPEQSYVISNLTVLKDNHILAPLENYQFYTADMNAGSAPGDSGGPAMTVVNNRYYQVGIAIAAWHEKVERGIYNHGVYGAIGPFCDSIKKVTSGMAYCQ